MVERGEMHRGRDGQILMITAAPRNPLVLIYILKMSYFKSYSILLSLIEGMFRITGCEFE